MDLRSSNRPSRPAATAQRPAAAPTPAGTSNFQSAKNSRPKSPVLKWGMIGGAVLLTALGVYWWHVASSAAPRSDRYQVVFMDNDQVFFGKLKNTHGDYLRLEGAYSTRQAPESDEKSSDDNIALVKVDDLVYGPEDVMMIRADKVKFWQDLQSESKVTKAIEAQR